MFWRLLVAKNTKIIFSKENICCTTPLIANLILTKAHYCNVEKLEIKAERIKKSDTKNEKIFIPNITDIKKAFPNTNVDVGKHMNQQKKSMKFFKYFCAFFGMSVIVIGTYILFNVEFSDDETQNLSFWKKYLLNIRKQINTFTIFIQEPSRDKLLPDPVTYPYYQPPYTLVLEFTDVLAHPDWTYKTGWRFKKRPGLDYFLENLVGHYEIVVFTAEPGMTIFPVIDALDQKHLISYKLVRDSTHFVDGHHVKNLDKLNRDLRKVIVIDWNPESLKFHPDNHFNLPRWIGEDSDATLVDLTAFLKTIAHTEIEDVREVLKFYKQFDDPLGEFRKKQKEYYEQSEQITLDRPAQSIKKRNKNKSRKKNIKNQYLRPSLEASLQKKSKDNEAVQLIQSPDTIKNVIKKVNNNISAEKFNKTPSNTSREKGDVLKISKKKIKTDGSGKVLKRQWKKLVKKYSKDVDNLNKKSEQLHSQKEKEQEKNKRLKLMLELLKQKAGTEKLIIQKSNSSSSKVDKDTTHFQKLKGIKKQQNMHNDSLAEPLVKSNQNLSLKLKKKQQFYSKLKQTLEETKSKKPVVSLRQKMMEKLKAARFRFLNEQIYTANSKEAQKIFQSDPEAFKAYHEGYQQQVKNWPLNPLDYIIRSIKKMPKFYTIADFGCGDAKLAMTVEQNIHSFDLVAVNESVVACDMSNVPLEDGSVDVAVFCLSLMGTNLNDYILEANRVLKVGGTLKIAEVESRFENIDDFVKGLQQFGFRNVWRDLSHNLFYFLDFTKVVSVKSKRNYPH